MSNTHLGFDGASSLLVLRLWIVAVGAGGENWLPNRITKEVLYEEITNFNCCCGWPFGHSHHGQCGERIEAELTGYEECRRYPQSPAGSSARP